MLVDLKRMDKKKILITGGGSGGHLSSANALIECLTEEYLFPKENLLYVGGDLGMEGEKPGNSLEQREMKNKEFKTVFIRAGKLQRKVSFTSVRLLLRTVLGFFDAFKILSQEKPSLVISTGGFVSVPVCTVAWIKRIPVFLHEQTASVGLSNKVVGKFAKKIYVAFKDSLKYFKKEKAVHVGNNVRKSIFRKEITEKTNKDIVNLVQNKGGKNFLYISGGSLGSQVINKKVLGELDSLLERYVVLLQTGSNEKQKGYELAKEKLESLPEEKKSSFLPIQYIDDESIGYVLNNMDLFLGRAGANTVYEIGVLKKYALFIPIPWVTNNEQYLNAKVLEKIGSAKILEEKYLNETTLLNELEQFKKQLLLRDIEHEKLEELFPLNASSTMISDILKNIS